MNRPFCLLLSALSTLSALPLGAAQNGAASILPTDAATAINTLGIQLLSGAPSTRENALVSPYSLQVALAMTYAGAAGQTQTEMAKVLQYPAEEARLHASFAALQRSLDELVKRSAARAERSKRDGSPRDAVTLTVANRIYGQADYAFRPPFLNFLQGTYGAPLETVDFKHNPAAATGRINDWVDGQTRHRIQHLIPNGALDRDTRLVLVNAIYLKAPWAEEFSKWATTAAPFFGKGTHTHDVATMVRQASFGYAKQTGYTALTIPYLGGDLHFLVLLPDKTNGLAEVESNLSSHALAGCANLPRAEVILHLPKFRLEPPVAKLADALKSMGMKSAFDEPHGSANFDRMAPRKPDDYLAVSEVFHKTFLSLDEQGTEAAAASAVAMLRPTGLPLDKPKPIEVRVDHPFLFAIQHRPSGACLFLGRLTDVP